MTPKKPKKAEPGNRLEAIENTQEKASVDTPADTYSVEAHTHKRPTPGLALSLPPATIAL